MWLPQSPVNPKPCGKLLIAHQQESFLPFSSRQSLSCCLSYVAKGGTPKLIGPNSGPSGVVPTHSAKAAWSSSTAAAPGFKSRASLPPQPHFRLLPQSVTPVSIPVFFQLYWAAIVSLGRCGPMAWSQSSPSSHAGPVTRGELPPSYIFGGSHFHPPDSKHGHSYLTCP